MLLHQLRGWDTAVTFTSQALYSWDMGESGHLWPFGGLLWTSFTYIFHRWICYDSLENLLKKLIDREVTVGQVYGQKSYVMIPLCIFSKFMETIEAENKSFSFDTSPVTLPLLPCYDTALSVCCETRSFKGFLSYMNHISFHFRTIWICH